jgi:malate synthase
MPSDIHISGTMQPDYHTILTPDALAFVARLQHEFGPRRAELLQNRATRQADLSGGGRLDFLNETSSVRESNWTVASAPADLNDRRVEITGPVERKMVINALNSGARVFMADFEDSLSPTWDNVIQGQVNLRDAVQRTIAFENPDGRRYQLNDETATLLVRPRGWHLDERHAIIGNEPLSASLFDFGLYFFHNARELIQRGSGPYFYLPKLQNHREARLWNDVFLFAQNELGIPNGTIRATVLIEHIQAAFEMEEILYELREHSAGLNAGRWDYIFSVIKTFRHQPSALLPDRAQVTMTVPFMRAYTELLVRTCHKRGAHAIGGMAAFIPTRRDPEVNENALAKVREDKEREAGAGFDGTWVAHPGLIAIAQQEFDNILGEQPHQKDRLRADVSVPAADLADFAVPGGTVTEDGVRNNVSVALQYINSWLNGIGAAAIYNLMEDAATAEISRAQLWQWITHSAQMESGGTMTRDLYRQICAEEVQQLGGTGTEHYDALAAQILDDLVLSDHFTEFLTTIAYPYLD